MRLLIVAVTSFVIGGVAGAWVVASGAVNWTQVKAAVAKRDSGPEESALVECARRIHRQGRGMFGPINCLEYAEIARAAKPDWRKTGETSAEVVAEIDLTFKKNFGSGSGIADACAGGMWSGGSIPSEFQPGQTLRVTTSFRFAKFQSGWQCREERFTRVKSGYMLK